MQSQNQLYRFIRQGKSFSGHERNCCFLNLGQGRFANISATSGLDFSDDARALALTDWDRDGDLDLWIANRTGPRLRFLQNESPVASGVIQLRLVGTSGNRDGIGTRVTLTAGDQRQQRSLRAGDGYLAQSSKWLHFALPEGVDVATLKIDWYGDKPQTIDELRPGRYLIEEGRPASPAPVVGSAEAAVPSSAATADAPRVDLPDADASAPIVAQLHSPVAVPTIPVLTASGEPTSLRVADRKQVFVLWASWCPPCLAELQGLVEHWSEIEPQCLVTGICLDGAPGQKTTIADGEAAARRLALPFDSWFASAATLERLQAIHDQVLGWQTPLPIPSTFVLDEQHRLTTVIKGALPAADLLELVQSKSELPRDHAVWLRVPRYDLAFMTSMLLEQDALDDAIAYLSDYGSHFHQGPRYATVVSQLATRLAKADRLEEAERFFSEAVALDKQNAAWQNDLGTVKYRRRDVSGAVARFRAAARLAPDNAAIQRNLASVLISQGKLVEAVDLLKAAVARAPNSGVRLILADALRQAGQAPQAMQQYREVLQAEPQNVVALRNLGATLLATRQITEAIPLLQRAVQLAPEDPGTLKNLGLAFAVAGQHDRAIEMLTRRATLPPPDASVYHNLGTLYAQRGDLEEARRHFQQASALAPRNPNYRRNLEDLERQLRTEETGDQP
ncbi:MAG: tetratricopeptide repeat protein [Planctomycetota bacterium]